MAKTISYSYEEKLQIANSYISELAGGITWDDLPDINSLHDADTKEEIFLLCNDRLAKEDFPLDDYLTDL